MTTADPYAADPAPTFWQRHVEHGIAAAVFVFTILLTVLAFPPSSTPEFAYLFAAPAVFWAYRSPAWRLYACTVLGAGAVSWTILLGWLHNVTWGGLFALGPIVGVWIGSWFLAVRWVMPRMVGRRHFVRILAVFGLAGLWVVIEWTRQWLLGGFPWLPLAASQWQRVAILQIAAYTGAGGVSFVLIVMNLGFAAYAHRLLCEGRELLSTGGEAPGRGVRIGFAKRSQEFMAAVFLLLVCISVHMQEAMNRGRFARPAGTFAIVQPAIAQTLKWDPAQGPAILEVLETETLKAAALQPAPDVLLWPEATTPWAVLGDSWMQTWVGELTARAGRPLVLGSIVIENENTPQEAWWNGVLVADPTSGVRPDFYAKRKLVPFGEYVPLRSSVLGWIDKVVPVGGDFQHGIAAEPLRVAAGGSELALGALICYEDVFGWPARDSVLAGADVLMVQTNGGWFGQGGAAFQHAAHSVLRAVELRRPLLRAGNAGWSGWIDEFGSIRAVVAQQPDGTVTTDPALANTGTIYFRGSAVIPLSVDTRWVGQLSFYARHGDWFVAVGAGLALLAWVGLRQKTDKSTDA